MERKVYKSLGEELYFEKLSNGLAVIVIPKPDFNKKFAFFATDYGGADRRFKIGGQWRDTPEGVAHFLEHKMFDTEDGNALEELSGNGASPNAFTGTAMTAYHFECTDRFDDNLRLMLSFVSVPYFTDESVEKEQGIIGQEIRMTEDEPDYAVYYGLMKALYRHNPLRDSVAGTVESIAQITKETLYACHKVFYNPSNMVLCVAGNVKPEDIIKAANDILPKEPGEVPARDYGRGETLIPETFFVEKEMEVSLPSFLIGCKHPPLSDGEGYLKNILIAELALEMIAGHSCPLYFRLYDSGLIDSGFSASFEAEAGAAHSVIGGDSCDPSKVFEEIKKEARLIAENGPDAGLFSRVKKAAWGGQLRMTGSPERLCIATGSSYFRNYDFFSSMDVLESITADDVRTFFREHFSPENMAISIVKPKA